MPFPGKPRSEFARSTAKGCGPLRLESPGGGNNSDARCMMPHATFVERRICELQLNRVLSSSSSEEVSTWHMYR